MNYQQRLRAEYQTLVQRTVNLRRLLQKGHHAFSGDDLDKRRGIEDAARELAIAEREKAKLRLQLSMPEPAAPVKLDVPVTPSARRGAVKSVRRVVPSFVTRMINGPGCR